MILRKLSMQDDLLKNQVQLLVLFMKKSILLVGFICIAHLNITDDFLWTKQFLFSLMKQLEILQATCSMFPIQHKPNERVQLRSSIHTGSVVAGVQVVGYTHRQIDRQTHRQTHSQTYRQTYNIKIDIQLDTQIDRWIDRQTDSQ